MTLSHAKQWMRPWPSPALIAVMTQRSVVQLAQEMAPFKDELPATHADRASGPSAADLAAIETIPAAPSLDPHGCQV